MYKLFVILHTLERRADDTSRDPDYVSRCHGDYITRPLRDCGFEKASPIHSRVALSLAGIGPDRQYEHLPRVGKHRERARVAASRRDHVTSLGAVAGAATCFSLPLFTS
ncbi:hypothetical protein BaRGS_00015297 [Batillaria attramentaria]|uniref:Uncharacterized protein n=1 Tax=Batillaria attramentaria TaxID=370345 RepID=A0ABD0L1W3_9CAEN